MCKRRQFYKATNELNSRQRIKGYFSQNKPNVYFIRLKSSAPNYSRSFSLEPEWSEHRVIAQWCAFIIVYQSHTDQRISRTKNFNHKHRVQYSPLNHPLKHFTKLFHILFSIMKTKDHRISSTLGRRFFPSPTKRFSINFPKGNKSFYEWNKINISQYSLTFSVCNETLFWTISFED